MSAPVRGRMRLSGSYAGPVSRLIAFALDTVVVTVTYTVVVAGFVYLVRLLTSISLDSERAQGLGWTVGIIAWAFVYSVTTLAIAGRTPGKALVGLRVVERDGSPLLVHAALIRTLTLPLTFLTLGIGFVGVVIGRERRALHDVWAGTTVVYDWGDRPAELSAPLTKFLERSQAVPGPPE